MPPTQYSLWSFGCILWCRRALLTLTTGQAAVSARIGKSDNERFLEQFGYIIVASQLLNEQSAPSYTTVTESLSYATDRGDLPALRGVNFDLRGAAFTAGASFVIVWLLNWTRPRRGHGFDIRRILISAFFLVVVGVAFYAFMKRQWLKYLRRQAVDVGTVLIGNAQAFDSAAAASVVLIQEVELVSRGYRLSVKAPCCYCFGFIQVVELTSE